MQKRILLLASSLLVLSILAACGGGGGAAPTQAPAAQQPQAGTQQAALPAGDPAKGKELFSTCAGCHGPDAKGLPNLGKDMTTSAFIKSQSDEQLLAFVKKGRPASDPANTTGVDMPPKGGNPALTDAQLMDIIAYIRTLQQ